jgi:DNA-binding NarL/FixJ family response regulator
MPDARNFTRVMLADDHAIVREGYRALLQKQDRLQVVAEAGNGADAYRVYKEVKPDLVIMDVSMPGIGGVEAIRRIRQWDNSARILVFTMHQSAAYAVQAFKAGARGFVTKSSPPEALLRAIEEVMAGRIALSPDIDHELAINRLAGEPSAVDALSPREFEILRMLLAEKSVEEIAETLHISVKTAANTRYLIRAKLGVASDIELYAWRFASGSSQRKISGASRIRGRLDRGGIPDFASLHPGYRPPTKCRRPLRAFAVRILPHNGAWHGLRSEFRSGGVRRRLRPPRAIRLRRRRTRQSLPGCS